jgi:hypothetical protein
LDHLLAEQDATALGGWARAGSAPLEERVLLGEVEARPAALAAP